MLIFKFVNEKIPKNSDYAFPFAKGSIHLIRYLCSMLSIGENEFSDDDKTKIKKQNEILFIMFAINNDGIYEFFAKCLWLFHRLWVEMKAQSLDFERVIYNLIIKNFSHIYFGLNLRLCLYLKTLYIKYYPIRIN